MRVCSQPNDVMQDLLQKIEANAAQRLTLPPGRAAVQELPRYKGFLKVETHRLKILHRAGSGGLDVCHARSAILDVLLRCLWTAAVSILSDEARKEFRHVALVALGGYGRSELNPHSDIDFMFLHHGQVADNQPLPYLSRIIDGILYPLWDISLKVGHSVRSINDCVKVANSDMQSKTSLIEARFITGDEALFQRFQKTLLARSVETHEEEYIAMRLEDQETRRAKFGNSASMQEPNIKNGCGGLRDFQNLIWMSFFKYRTRSLQDLQAKDLLSAAEGRQLRDAYDFLLRVRTEMHYHLGRGLDVLTKNAQPAVAYNLGYRDRSPSRRIEVFMREVYTRSRNIYLITRTLEQRLALLPNAKPSRLAYLRGWLPERHKYPRPEAVDGFTFRNGQILPVSPRVFREQPRRLMRVFLHAQQRGLSLHPDLAQMIRNQLALVDRGFLADEHVRETFFTILNQRGNVAPVLRAMHEVDFLGKYIPEFGKLTCLVQHEFYHQYTADEHTLVCLEQLDRLWEAKEPPRAAYAPLFQGIERPYLLYLALLLHDVGKAGDSGDHAQDSGKLALRVARRLGLDGAATHTLRLLIEHHLLMAGISQRRDLDDINVIRQFAKTVQNAEQLTLLTLLTFVDAQATSDKLWNGFKDSLLWALHTRTIRLMSDAAEFVRAEEKQRELLVHEVGRLLPAHLSQEELAAHFAALPPRYFQIHSAREILDDMELAHRFMGLQISEGEGALSPVVSWHKQLDRGCNAVKICTWDRAGLFRKIAGSLSAAGLNILTAQIFTRADGFVLDTFSVTDGRTGDLGTEEQHARFDAVLKQALTGESPDFHALIVKQKNTRPLYQGYAGERIPTRIRIDNDASETRTLIEIETEDRIGLLYEISQTLTELELDISAAKIVTEKGAAIDSIYVGEIDGGKVLAAQRQHAIDRKLRQAIHALDRTA